MGNNVVATIVGKRDEGPAGSFHIVVRAYALPGDTAIMVPHVTSAHEAPSSNALSLIISFLLSNSVVARLSAISQLPGPRVFQVSY